MRDLHPGIEEYISRLEPWQQRVFFEVRELILSLHPMMEEHFLFSTPFYKLKGLFCYFTVLKKGNITVLGICDGYLIADTDRLFATPHKQKQVRHIVFYPGKLPPAELVVKVLEEALLLRTQK